MKSATDGVLCSCIILEDYFESPFLKLLNGKWLDIG